MTKEQEFKAAQIAFATAILSMRLSANATDYNYAGNYLFMGTDKKGFDSFLNKLTRKYLDGMGADVEVMNYIAI